MSEWIVAAMEQAIMRNIAKAFVVGVLFGFLVFSAAPWACGRISVTWEEPDAD